MLMRTDPFRDLDRLTDVMRNGLNRPTALPMDTYREGSSFVELESPAWMPPPST